MARPGQTVVRRASKQERLSETVKIRVTPSELEEWPAYAARSGRSLSEVVRVDVADEIAYDAALRGDLHATPRI
jgi:hypothetical protein